MMTDNTPNTRCRQPVGPNGIVNKWSSNDVQIHKTEYIWIIRRFSFQYANIDDLRSSTFTTNFNGSDKYTWYLKLHPKSDDPDFIALYLYLDSASPCTRAFAKVRFSVMTSNHTEMYISSNLNAKEFNISHWPAFWGYSEFLNRNQLFDGKDELLPDDNLTIFCEITHYLPKSVIRSNSITIEPCDSNINRLSEDFGSLLKNSKFSDITIVVNGIEYPVHRNVLAARSAVFSAMFEQNGMLESARNRIDVTDISEYVMEEMLRYIYTGSVANLDDLADDLFEAADKYDLGELKALCENFLNNDLSIDNAASTLALADLHRAYGLKFKTMDYIVSNFNEVKDTEGWKTLAGSRNDLLNAVCQAFYQKFATLTEKLRVYNPYHDE